MPVTRAIPPRDKWVSFMREALERERAEMKLSGRALRAVAAPEDLVREFGDSFLPESNSIRFGGRLLNDAMARGTRDLQREFHDLGAEFVYPLAPLLNELRVQSGLILLVADSLNVVEDKFGTSMDAGMRRRWTEARELYVEGCGKAAEMLFPEALEWLVKAEERFPTDFTIQFELGWVFLYGVSQDDSVVDFARAEEHLRRAVRYGKGAVRRRPEMATPTAEALLHLSLACFLQAGPGEAGQERVAEARDLAVEAQNTNPKLSHAYYHQAKYCARLGQTRAAVKALELAVRYDRRFALTADADEDLSRIQDQVLGVVERVRDEQRHKADASLAKLERLKRFRADLAELRERSRKLETEISRAVLAGTNAPIDHVIYPGRKTEARERFDTEAHSAQRAFEKMAKLLERSERSLEEAEQLVRRAKDSAGTGTFFAFQDAQPLAEEATTPLKRVDGNLADAVMLAEAAESRLPVMERLMPGLIAERAANRRTHAQWQVVQAVRAGLRTMPRFAAGGALVALLGRIVYFFATGEFNDFDVRILVVRALPLIPLGAGLGALLALVWSFRNLAGRAASGLASKVGNGLLRR
jgi:tetratricopeptide (TPR) repeat protein